MYDCHHFLFVPSLAKEGQERCWMVVLDSSPLPPRCSCRWYPQVHPLLHSIHFLCKKTKVNRKETRNDHPFLSFRFWIMPNLTKDVGFIRSFWPLYEYTYTGEYIGDVGDDEGDEKKEAAPGYNDESDSNESGKSAFEFVDKNKDD